MYSFFLLRQYNYFLSRILIGCTVLDHILETIDGGSSKNNKFYLMYMQ